MSPSVSDGRMFRLASIAAEQKISAMPEVSESRCAAWTRRSAEAAFKATSDHVRLLGDDVADLIAALLAMLTRAS